jgi:hypothetical protein
MAVTGQLRPEWTPLPLRGISSSSPVMGTVLDREGWTVTTSFAGSKDEAVGGDKPKYIIDDDRSTAFCFVKPGKSYNGVTVPANHVPSFTIDMQTPVTISLFRYAHRTGNTEAMLRARRVSLYGKNAEGEEFTPIIENVALTVSRDEERVDFPPVACRYVKLVYNDWDTVNGSTIQVAEFNLGPGETVTPPIDTTVTPPDIPIDTTPEPPTGIWDASGDAQQGSCTIYPNPVRVGQPFHISWGEQQGSAVTITVYDMMGRKIRERVATSTPATEVIHTQGIFFISIELPSGKRVIKVNVVG